MTVRYIFSGNIDKKEMQLEHFQFSLKKAIALRIELQGPFKHFFAILQDADRQLRAVLTFKTRRHFFWLAETESLTDNNTVAGKLPAGKWQLTIFRACRAEGKYKVIIDSVSSINELQDLCPAEGFKDPVIGTEAESTQDLSPQTVNAGAYFNPLKQDFSAVKQAGAAWYRGDLHAHTYYTDGRVGRAELSAAAQKHGLAFFALSDHSVFTTKFPVCNQLVVPAAEITWDNAGHYNVFGLKRLYNYAAYAADNKDKSAALQALFNALHQDQAVLSINHPFPYAWQMEHDFDLALIDCLEIINSPHRITAEVDNEKALRFFDYLWLQNHCLMGIGGSDAHKRSYFGEYPLGMPQTKLYLPDLNLNNILQALRQGNALVQAGVDCEVEYTAQQDRSLILPGTYFEGKVDLKARCRQPVCWELVQNGKIIYSRITRKFQRQILVKLNDFYRLQARNDEGEICFFSNPVHAKKRVKTKQSFQEILQLFKLQDQVETD